MRWLATAQRKAMLDLSQSKNVLLLSGLLLNKKKLKKLQPSAVSRDGKTVSVAVHIFMYRFARILRILRGVGWPGRTRVGVRGARSQYVSSRRAHPAWRVLSRRLFCCSGMAAAAYPADLPAALAVTVSFAVPSVQREQPRWRRSRSANRGGLCRVRSTFVYV